MSSPATHEALQAIVNAPDSLVLTVNSDKTISFVSQPLANLLGFKTKEQLQAEPLSELFPDPLFLGDLSSLLENPSHKIAPQYQLSLKHQNGFPLSVDARLAPLFFEEKNHVLITLSDTSQKGRESKVFERIIENSPIAMVMVNGEGTILFANKQVEILFGYTNTEVVGQAVELLVPDEIKERHVGLRSEYLKHNPQPRQMGAGRELMGQHKNGKGVPIEIALNPTVIQDELHVVASIIDISERRKQEELSKRIIESSPVAMVMVDAAGHIIFTNKLLSTIFGYSQDELNGAPIEILVPEEVRTKHIDLRNLYLKGNPVPRQMGQESSIYGQHKNGYKIPLEVGLNPIQVGDHQYVIGSVIDITERKKQEELSVSMIEGSPMAMLMIDSQGMIVNVNKKMVTLFGYEREELKGALIEKLLPENIREKHVALRDAYISGNPQPRQMGAGRDLFGRTKDGSLLPVEIGLNPILVGKELHIIAALVDITERKEQQENMKQLLHNLERSNKELQEFAYVASHDLQEPLRKVESFGNLLYAEAKDVLNEEAMSYVNHMRDASARMHVLINDLLAFSRLSTQQKEFEEVNLDETVEIILSDMHEHIKELGATVTSDPLGTIEGDKTQLYQLLKNLISNALKYHRNDTPPVVKIHAHREYNQLKIEVEDNGIGFDMQFAQKIFVIFQRLHAKTEYSGTGIGLAMCRKIVGRLNGTISAQSIVGQGSTFTVELPVTQRKLHVDALASGKAEVTPPVEPTTTELTQPDSTSQAESDPPESSESSAKGVTAETAVEDEKSDKKDDDPPSSGGCPFLQ